MIIKDRNDFEVILTPKEIQALRLIAQDKTAKDIGIELGVSKRTIEARIDSAKTKLRVRYVSTACVLLCKAGVIK